MSKSKRIERWRLFPSLGMLLIAFAACLSSPAIAAASFEDINLVTDDQLIKPAQQTDPNLKNAWGISFGPATPFWVSDNGAGVSTLYNVNPATDATTVNPLVVTIPGAGTITGQVFNGTTNFNTDRFLFVSEDGTISGWRPALGTAAETLVAASVANVYKGAALATVVVDTYLYAANFRAGTIDVIKGNPAAPNLTGTFTDPTIPAGFAPFNIQLLGGNLYVAYALQDANKLNDVPGQNNGFVSVFDTSGNFLARVATHGALNSPWGLAIAPASFGPFAGKLLVGNSGDGRINAFDLSNNTFVGQLSDKNGIPLTISEIKGLTIGNGVQAGSTEKIYFSAGPQGGLHGIFGVIQPNKNLFFPAILRE